MWKAETGNVTAHITAIPLGGKYIRLQVRLHVPLILVYGVSKMPLSFL
jgi:hypothetical protein